MEKISVVGEITIKAMGQLEVKIRNSIQENGVEITAFNERYVKTPDQDISDEPKKVQEIAKVIWTDQVKADWNTFLEGLQNGNNN